MWDSSTYTKSDLVALDKADPGNHNAVNPDLRGFEAKGGKLIHYVGLSDAFVTAGKLLYYIKSNQAEPY